MRRRLVLLGIVPLMLTTGCQRSGAQVWQDTKTAGRYVGCAFRSLSGKHPDLATDQDVHIAYEQSDFIPLDDGDLYRQIAVGDPAALDRIDADTPIPQSNASPGEPGSAIPGIDGFFEPRGSAQADVFRHIHFDTNKYDVNGQENTEVLKAVAKYLKKHSNTCLFIEGHCDERGTDAYNLSLGSRRSNAVRNFLIKEGVDLNQVFTTSYGKERPIARGHDTESWVLNRRSQFKIYEKH